MKSCLAALTRTTTKEISVRALSMLNAIYPSAWAPVIRKGYWEVELQGVTMDGKDMGFTTKRAAIDTGI